MRGPLSSPSTRWLRVTTPASAFGLVTTGTGGVQNFSDDVKNSHSPGNVGSSPTHRTGTGVPPPSGACR